MFHHRIGLNEVEIRDYDTTNLLGRVVAGRKLTEADEGQPFVMLPRGTLASGIEITARHVGQTLIIEMDNNDVLELEIIGIYANESPFWEGFVAADTIPGRTEATFTTVMVEEEHLADALISFSACAGHICLKYRLY